jgi:hypothetical protein
MRKFFEENLSWWEISPAHELIEGGMAYALASEGKSYAVYLPEAQRIALRLPPGKYAAKWFNPRSGEYVHIAGDISAGHWQCPQPPGPGDWAIVVKKK